MKHFNVTCRSIVDGSVIVLPCRADSKMKALRITADHIRTNHKDSFGCPLYVVREAVAVVQK